MTSRTKRKSTGTRSGSKTSTIGAIRMNTGIMMINKTKRTTNAMIRSTASVIANCSLGSVIERSLSASGASRAEAGLDVEAGAEAGVEVEAEIGAEEGVEVGTGAGVEVGAGAGTEVEAEAGTEAGTEMGVEAGGPGTELMGSELKLCSLFFTSGRELSFSFSSFFAWATAME